MKYIALIVLLTIIFLSKTSPTFAIVDPLETPNNKFGVHIVDENDLEDAARLVNSSGGEWGYVTLVIREDEKDIGRWQEIFDRMRELKLIPIIRLATKGTALGWEVPTTDEADDWAEFLNQLNWVVQNRYIILFNEPNQAHEWGGSVSPGEYAEISRFYRDTLKATSPDFFILPAGFDQAAADTNSTSSITSYFQQMYDHDPGIFTIFDGWTSHAYPNPHFSGSIEATGRQSIRGHEWEVDYLSQYGLPKHTPLFITETGWAHREGAQDDPSFKPAEEVAELMRRAYNDIWTNPTIVMISPFLLNYQAEPFDHFSWRKPNSSEFYPQYSKILEISKEDGSPIQLDGASITLANSVTSLITDSTFFLPIKIHNNGQTIWQPDADTKLMIRDGDANETTIVLPTLRPFDTAVVKFPITTPPSTGTISLSLTVERDSKVLTTPVTIAIPVKEEVESRNTILEIIKELVMRRLPEVAFAYER